MFTIFFMYLVFWVVVQFCAYIFIKSKHKKQIVSTITYQWKLFVDNKTVVLVLNYHQRRYLCILWASYYSNINGKETKFLLLMQLCHHIHQIFCSLFVFFPSISSSSSFSLIPNMSSSSLAIFPLISFTNMSQSSLGVFPLINIAILKQARCLRLMM